MKRLSIICLIAVLALAVMGFGFAKWSDNVTISAAADSGEVDWGFLQNSFMQKDQGPDWTSIDDLDMLMVEPVPEGKDVGNCSGAFSDTDADGTLDTLTVTVNNAYPYYYDEFSAKVYNFGTIPVIISGATLTWMGHEYDIITGEVYFLHNDGTISPSAGGTTYPDNAVMEICWMDNDGQQQHPGVAFEESFDIQVLQPAAQSTAYTFGISLEGAQWNEIR